MGFKKIRIAHIITRMDRGGAPDVVRILIEQADPALFDMVLIYGRTLVPTDRVKDFLGKLGSGRVYQIDALRRDVHPFFDVLAFIRILALLKKEKFDIVHTHTAKAGFLGRIAARCAGVRVVVHSPHGHNFYGYFRAVGSRLVVWAERLAGVYCDKIHALTKLEKTDMAGLGILKEDKIEVIYCGVELDFFQRNAEAADVLKKTLGIPANVPVAGYVGRLEPVKGPKYFIRAAGHVHKRTPEARFIVAGEGALRPRLEREARRLGMADVVHFIGWQEDAASVYSALDVLVLPSLNEAVGRSLLEAQAVGVAIVASKVGGVPEIIQDGITGVLFAPRDVKSLAEIMARLLKDPSWRETLIAAGRARVKEFFEDRLMVRHFTELYHQMLLNRK